MRVVLRASDAAGLLLLEAALPWAARPERARAKRADAVYSLVVAAPGSSGEGSRSHQLFRDEARIARSRNLDGIRRAFDRDLSILIGDRARRRVFVHAGVVGFEHGAVMVPGKSLSGKTTLTRALVEAGGTYYSDEFAVLDPRGRVFPWPEPLSIRSAGATKAGERRAAESLGFTRGRRPLPIRLVVLTSYGPGRRFRPATLAPGPATLGVLEHTLSARSRPRASLRAIGAALAGAIVVKGPRGEARETAKLIVKLLEPRAKG